MRLTSLFAFAALGLALSPLACASVDDEDAAAQETAVAELNGVAITEADDGKTLTVTEGQDVVVKLASNPTTGFSWHVVSTNRSFGYPDSTEFIPSSGATGAGGVEQLTWKTRGFLPLVGAHTVKLEYKRGWETDVPPLKTFTFTVNIVAPECPSIHPPAPGFCWDGELKVRTDENGCTVGFDCEPGCGGGCGAGATCMYCWGTMQCVPNGALC